MLDASTPSLHVAQARELFFMQGRDPDAWLAPHISRSWRRSRPIASDNPDTAPITQAQLAERREQSMRLLQCAQPELDGLAEHAVGNGCVVILTDAGGLILDEIGSPDFLPKAERVALKPGVVWSEGCRGTNAIGTALAERDALMVLGGEHFLPQNGAIGCAAAPIFSGRGEVVGALDISGETLRVNQHALGLVRMAAQQVEHRLLLSGASGRLLRFHQRSALLGTAREGLVVIDDGRVVGANRAALGMLGLSWDSLLDRSARELLGPRWGGLEQQRGLLTLSDGRQIAAVMEVSRARSPARASKVATVTVETTPREEIVQHAPPDALHTPLARAVRVMNEGVSVLVTGETGAGKEVFARRLHAASRRRAGPFVAVNCAALPETLIEAELFGYDEGAFTGARRKGMPGRIREAQHGVLFLDEIADMPLPLQTRLLRVLEERVVSPLGGGPAVAVDFDLICATHGDVHALSLVGRFRIDLLYRIAGFEVALPALRERSDRHALIAQLFGEFGGSKQLQLQDDALALLAAHAWPGNVRELRSVLRAVCALAEPGDCITPAQLPAHVPAHTPAHLPASLQRPADTVATPCLDVPAHLPSSLTELTRHAVAQALHDCGNDVAEAARRLGVHRSTVYRHRARQSRTT